MFSITAQVQQFGKNTGDMDELVEGRLGLVELYNGGSRPDIEYV
jgi:hypothetical protein